MVVKHLILVIVLWFSLYLLGLIIFRLALMYFLRWDELFNNLSHSMIRISTKEFIRGSPSLTTIYDKFGLSDPFSRITVSYHIRDSVSFTGMLFTTFGP